MLLPFLFIRSIIRSLEAPQHLFAVPHLFHFEYNLAPPKAFRANAQRFLLASSKGILHGDGRYCRSMALTERNPFPNVFRVTNEIKFRFPKKKLSRFVCVTNFISLHLSPDVVFRSTTEAVASKCNFNNV